MDSIDFRKRCQAGEVVRRTKLNCKREREIGEAMTPRVVMEHVFAEPFQPFRIHTASGRIFEVRHPEFVKIGRNTLTIYAPPESDPNGSQRWEEVALVLIESIAPSRASVNTVG